MTGQTTTVDDTPRVLGDLAATDIYLIDQLLRGRVRAGCRVLDAGCGFGRNLPFFLRAGHPVSAVDADPACIAAVRELAARLAPALPPENFRCEPIEELGFEDGSFDLVISNAVLHFATGETQFDCMVTALWRVLAPGGVLFVRLASTIGMEGRFSPRGGRRFQLLDGSERYLVDQPQLLELTARLGGELLDPIKTTIVQDQRAMTTWVVGRPAVMAPTQYSE